jgi:hypothetical protein
MATDLSFTYVPDVSADNSALVLACSGPPLSAGVWVARRKGAIQEARTACLAHVMAVLAPSEIGWEAWVMVGHRAPQRDNRIGRHTGILKALSRRKIGFSCNNSVEVVHKYEDGLRSAGGIKVDVSELPAVNAAMMSENAVVILAPRERSQDIAHRLVKTPGVLKGHRPPFGLLDATACDPVAVLAVYGEFDDPEVAVAVIGLSENLKMLGITPQN